jgi:hypothetical protein
VSYWASRYPKEILKAWTRQLLVESGHEIKQAAYRFLIKLGEFPRLFELAKAFSDYKQQHELSLYIKQFAKSEDIELLIGLNRRKAEKVVQASQSALITLINFDDQSILENMAKSNSRNTILTFERVALKLGEGLSLEEIRNGLHSRKLWQRLLSIYALAKKGNSEDLIELKDILQKKVTKKIKAAVIKTIVRLAIRFKNKELFQKYTDSIDNFTVEKTLEALDDPSEIIDIEKLFEFYNTYPYLVSKAIYNVSSVLDITKLKEILCKITLEPPAREFVYSLCRLGSESEFTFLFNLFLNYQGEINFWNQFAVVNEISNLAKISHLTLLGRVVGAKDFWNYYKEEELPETSMPIKDYSNAYFIKRLAGTAFGKAATRKDFDTVYKMLCHDYWIIRNAALEAIRKYGDMDDLKQFIEMLRGKVKETNGLVEAICIIDDKLFPIIN